MDPHRKGAYDIHCRINPYRINPSRWDRYIIDPYGRDLYRIEASWNSAPIEYVDPL